MPSLREDLSCLGERTGSLDGLAPTGGTNRGLERSALGEVSAALGCKDLLVGGLADVVRVLSEPLVAAAKTGAIAVFQCSIETL